MKGYLLGLLVLASGLFVGCGMIRLSPMQTFDKHDISFEVSRNLKLEEYTAPLGQRYFLKGPTTYEEGVVISTKGGFVFYWLKWPEPTPEEVRFSILDTPTIYGSVTPELRARIVGPLVKQRVGDFQVTYAEMQITSSQGKVPTGMTAVWYCPASQRVLQLIIIHEEPKGEMERFIQSLSCG